MTKTYYIIAIVDMHAQSRLKKLVKSNKSISCNFFLTNSIFCNFKNGQKSIFELEKSLKLSKMQFYEEEKDLFDFTSYFGLNFFKFSGPM